MGVFLCPKEQSDFLFPFITKKARAIAHHALVLLGGKVGAGDLFDLGLFIFLRPDAELFQRPEVGIDGGL